ncbi:DUF1492 domain-containing protein [Salisediminibacterium selenitireducens]|uniref:RNA polymerase, sigma-24 subunit, ECF subfamily n=1 Tax=Bacillus selenitireducens (strain ATCC 700615 / DSM 15326 / MLS10) TaxID=439292 RepID=D6XZD3_BACIE|nr:DUF1492 domain-containing protein [Salisediminibacterium selenitireducens]ADH98307.1 RNA polymerase, sigma-24 subunit, ECF subfamily [[Bacillus] selenitireducens MLS10]
MDTKTFLSQAIWLDRLIQSKVEQQGRLKELALKVTTTYQDNPVQGGLRENSRMEASLVDLMALGEEINADIDRLIEVKQEIRRAVKTVDNLSYQPVLEMRYLDGRSWDDVAEIMSYDKRTVHRIHGRAIRELENKGVTKCH